MRSKLTLPFTKRKTGFKLQDKRLISSSYGRGSAWSYSYDLWLNQICEEALKKEIKSDCSVTGVEDLSISRISFDEDLEEEFMFWGNKQNNELVVNDPLRKSATETLNHTSPEDTQEHRISKQGNNLDSATVSKMEQSVNNVNHLLLSDMQKKWSCLAKIIQPFPNDVSKSDETNHRNEEKHDPQIQATFIDYLEQLLQKTALPSQKLEQLRLEYCKEETKWKKQVDFLKQLVSSLKSELQNVKKAYSETAEQLTNFKTFYSQNQSLVGKNSDMNADSKMVSLMSENKNRKKFKLETSHIQKKLDRDARTCHEALSLSNKCKSVNPLMIKFPQKQHLYLKTTNCMKNKNRSIDTCVSLSKERKSSRGRTTLDNDRKCLPIAEKSSRVSLVSRLKQFIRGQKSSKRLTRSPTGITGRSVWL